MATLNEIVYNIKNLAEGGSSIDYDSKISKLQVEFLVHSYRANLLLNYTNSGRAVHPQTLQTLKHTSASDSVTYISFPALINFSNLKSIKSIKHYDDSAATTESVSLITQSQNTYENNNRFVNSVKKAYVQDGRLYLVNFNLDTDDYLEVTALFANPTEITTAEGAFDKDSTMYPLPTELINALTQEILSKEYRVVIGTPRDKEIDGEAPTEKVQRQVRQR